MFETPNIATDWSFIISLVLLAVTLAVAVYFEMKYSRIPNWLTLSAMGAGLICGYLPGGPTFGSSVLGLVIGFGFLFIFYVFGGIGGGDVKLMGAIGALVGHGLIGTVLFYTAVIGGFMAVVALIWRGRARVNAGKAVAVSAGSILPPPVANAVPLTIPYGLAIAGGCLLALLFESGAV